MKKRILLAAAFTGLLTLLASCGGGNGDQVRAASSNATANISAANGVQVVSSVANQNFAFDTGVPEFGTTGPTTVTFTSQTPTNTPDNTIPAQPGFAITSASGSASGVAEFGSCKFRVTSSTFTSGPLINGATVTISSCRLVLTTAGVPADGAPHSVSTTFALNDRVSKTITLQVTVSPDGSVSINARVITTVTTQPVTGGA